MTYDSYKNTEDHIARVRKYIKRFRMDLMHRAYDHDLSKLVEPEKSKIDATREQLLALDYGTEEYDRVKSQWSEHHYAVNDHHLEHYENGIYGMTLQAFCEMFCAWCAAVETHKEGDNIYDSIRIIAEKHKLDDQIVALLTNTAKEWGL